MLNIFSWTSLITLLFTLFLWFFVITPWLRIQSYKKEGVTTYFFPIMGMIARWIKDTKARQDAMISSKESSRKNPHEKYLVTHINRKTLILLRDPQYIKEFMHKQNLYHKANTIDFLKPLVGNGLTISEDEEWKRIRKIVSSSFHYDFLKTNTPVIQKTTQQFFNTIPPSSYENFRLFEKLQDITGEIVGRIFFGENLSEYYFEGKPLTPALAEILSELAVLSQTLPVFLFRDKVFKIPFPTKYTRLMEKMTRFRGLCMKIIEDGKAQKGQSQNLLASLLATQKSAEIENRFSDEDIVSEFINFFIAGMDTTAHLVGMALYNLAQHPKYLDDLKLERNQAYNKEKEVTAETLQKMEILHSIIKETLRIHTPAPFIFLREAMKEHNLLDLKMEKGDLLTPDFFAPYFNDKYFENPFEFNPGRWTNSENKIDPYAFLPFSAGQRNCIGQHLALMEAKVIISEFLEKFDFKLKEGYALKMVLKIMYEPETDILFVLNPKSTKN